MKKRIIKTLQKSIFLILPVVFLVLVIIIHFSYGNFYMVYVDPEYFHLLNGLNISIFNLSVDYIHHPGTTIQVIYAISAHIINFVEPGFNIIANAINDPEQFIHGANILMNIITTSTLFVLGIYTFKYTGNIFLALLLQLIPFGNSDILMISGRLMPEAALIAPLLVLALLVIRFINDPERDKSLKNYAIGFAIIGGIGMAGKFHYFPYLLIPLILIPSTKWKLKYLLYTFIAIVVFAFPVFIHPIKSWEWYSGMLMHSGQWGTGDSTIVDVNTFPEHLMNLFRTDQSFIIILILTAIQLITFYAFSLIKKTNEFSLQLKTMLAFLVAIILSILIVAKHYTAHYYIPTLTMKIFLIYLMATIFINLFQSKHIRIGFSVTTLLIGLTLVFMQKNSLSFSVDYAQKRAELFEERKNVLDTYNTVDHPIIITSNYRGSPFIESGLVDGFLLSGHLKVTFSKYLLEKYPNSFFYFNWDEDFYYWDTFLSASDFVDPEKTLYIFVGEDKEKNLDVIIERLKNGFPEYVPELVLLHHFTSPDEYFYDVKFNLKDSFNH